MLTDRHVAQFETFGFLVLRGVLASGELDTMRAEFDVGLARAAAATERRGIRKQLNWSNLGPETPFLGSLLEDSRFAGAAERFCGGPVIGFYANGNSFDGDRTEWHPDTSTLIRRGIKFAFYLQPLDERTGALRFIPGSHKEPLHSDLRKIGLKESNLRVLDAGGLEVEEVPAYVARSEPGDVIAFDNRVWHASWGGGQGRRMCSLGYVAVPATPAEEASMAELVRQDAELLEAFRCWRAIRTGSPTPRAAPRGGAGSRRCAPGASPASAADGRPLRIRHSGSGTPDQGCQSATKPAYCRACAGMSTPTLVDHALSRRR